MKVFFFNWGFCLRHFILGGGGRGGKGEGFKVVFCFFLGGGGLRDSMIELFYVHIYIGAQATGAGQFYDNV